MNIAWQRFLDEISRWENAGRSVEFWWRDDDAARRDPALRRLTGLAQSSGIPLALAVIPMLSETEIFEEL